MQKSQYSDENNPTDNKLDEEFIKLMIDIEKNYTLFKKHDKIRIEQWCKKLCQITINPTWKQNRNNYALLLSNCVSNGTLAEPFNKVPPEGSLPALNTHIVKKRTISKERNSIKPKVDSAKKIQKPREEPEQGRLLSYMYTPTKSEAPLKNSQNSVELRQTPQYSNLYYEPRHSIAQSENLANMSNYRFNTKENFNQMSQQVKSWKENTKKFMNGKEVMRLKSELDLTRINLESLKNDINIKNVTISQLNKKVDALQKNNDRLQSDKSVLVDLLRLVKKGIEDNSFNFVNQSLANNFLKQFNENCQQFFIAPLETPSEPLGRYSMSSSNKPRQSIKASPINAALSSFQLNLQTGGPDITNYNSAESYNRISTMNLTGISHSNNMSVQKTEELIFEDGQNFLSKRSNLSYMKSPHSNAATYEEARNLLQHTDRDTADFLDYLDKFQRENEKLRKETEELLIKSGL